MSVNGKTIREDIARARAYAAKNDYLKTLASLARAVNGVTGSKVFGREKFEVQALLEEAIKDLNGMTMIRKLFPNGLSYVRGKEKLFYQTLRRLHDKLKEAIEKSKVARQRKRLGVLDDNLLKAQELISKGDPLEARKIFRKASEYYSDIEGIDSDIGNRLLMGGLPGEAVEYFKRGLERNGSDQRAHGGLIAAFEAQGELDKAADAVKDAMRRLGGTESLMLKLAKISLSRRDWAEAHRQAQGVLERNPLNADAKKILKRVEPKIFNAAGKVSKGKGGAIKLDF
ncbi:tetratricopeptide repeat protein [Pseudodesulfovibrio senegalensis]|jgi:tetratricopeptide (TPR) repeat protein|uniref:Uncharacterized protein n=1 Tax=Pseudodesulfovibrio senegalensis TaxID=1721087 RepID=A0A6N6MX92_9BACT|nr:tetratricopeptide repeat protein [Pseudodesulfovibrio senegalensis]KAB1438815.1 hypothetical protein F8A88_15260 [Pseudodesulfovibrio senegalensis]